MAKYQQYAEYKDSGVEWLGEIPSHWKLTRIKYITECLDGARIPLNAQERGEIRGDIPYWGANKVVDYVNDFLFDEELVLLGEDGAPFFDKTKDVAFNVCGKVWPNNHVHVLRPNLNKVEPRFLKYALNCADYHLYISGSTRDKLNQSDMNDIYIRITELPELEKIANFLDYETAQIDTLIEKQQTLIKLLKEKRQAVISHAVTKGLNPDAPMKDSGVEWLGEVPEHWEVLPAKRFFKLVAEPAASNNDYELLSVYTAIGVRPRKDLEQKGNKASTTDGYWKVERGDIVVNKLLAWMGAVGYSDYEGVTSPAYDILRATKDINSKFYHYLFRTRLANMEFKRWSRGIMEMRLRLYFDELGRIFMPLPSKQEQDLIVKKIEKMDNQFDDLIKKSEYNIKLMQERRTALISAAVTGKIDVRGWRAPE